ncbi:FkbM family methyltransferase [Caballeronia hypogeia]|nr:FkbM family methyltransferase [Caballeronia hypogeia]
MIVNRNDVAVQDGFAYGVGHQLLNTSCFDPGEVAFVLKLLELRRRHFGDEVFAIDGGANIGVHSIEWARHMHGWGKVLSFEAQEIVYYALAGNLALNNCLNARARLAALGDTLGEIVIPQPDYYSAGSFGSLELRETNNVLGIGQNVSYDPEKGVAVPMINIDSLKLERLDFLKIDVEGMEMDVLRGAVGTLKRCAPILLVETIKGDETSIREFLSAAGYADFYRVHPNALVISERDPVRQHVSERDGVVYIGG